MADMPPRPATASMVDTWIAICANHPGWRWCDKCHRPHCPERARALAEFMTYTRPTA